MTVDFELEPLGSEDLEAIAFIEKHWLRFGKFPNFTEFNDAFPVYDIDSALSHKTFRIALVNRGIQVPVGPLKDANLNIPDDITKEQLAAIITIVNFEDRRSRTMKLKELGITVTQWQGWLKDEKFKTFLHDMSAANFEDASYIAQEALVRAMDRGDVSAIKFYGEVTGKLQPKLVETKQMANLRLIIAKLVESIQRHVKDPEQLRAIGEDFEFILSGQVKEDKQLEG